MQDKAFKLGDEVNAKMIIKIPFWTQYKVFGLHK